MGSAKPAGLLFGEIEQITQFSEAAVLIWSELHLRAGQSAIIPAQRTPVEDGVLLLSTPVKTLTPSPTARLLGTVNRQLVGLVAKSTGELPCQPSSFKNSRILNAEPVTLLLREIEEITRFSEAVVLIWLVLHLHAEQDVITPIRRTLMEDGVLPLSTPVKTLTPSPTARLPGTVNPQLIGLVAKYTGEVLIEDLLRGGF